MPQVKGWKAAWEIMARSVQFSLAGVWTHRVHSRWMPFSAGCDGRMLILHCFCICWYLLEEDNNYMNVISMPRKKLGV